jgi:hypothetical protein
VRFRLRSPDAVEFTPESIAAVPPVAEAERPEVAEPGGSHGRWLSVEEMLGAPVHPLMVGYDPRTYPDDPRLVGKAKKPQPPESVPMDCKAEWERIRAEDPWPDDLGYTI